MGGFASTSILGMPINNQTPDPRFQRVLVAAREVARLPVDERGFTAEWAVAVKALEQLRRALEDLEQRGSAPAASLGKKPVKSPGTST